MSAAHSTAELRSTLHQWPQLANGIEPDHGRLYLSLSKDAGSKPAGTEGRGDLSIPNPLMADAAGWVIRRISTRPPSREKATLVPLRMPRRWRISLGIVTYPLVVTVVGSIGTLPEIPGKADSPSNSHRLGTRQHHSEAAKPRILVRR